MTYDGTLRRQAVNTVLAAIKNGEQYFEDVIGRAPAALPAADKFPACYVALTTEIGNFLTAKERRSEFKMAIITFVFADSDQRARSLDLLKADSMDVVEASLMALYDDATFQGTFDRLDVDQIDYGPLALRQYGIPLDVMAPHGATRMDLSITFDYTAI